MAEGASAPGAARAGSLDRGWPTATAALTLATLAASASFWRVFAGPGWVAPVVSTALACHLVAWGARRSHLDGWASAALGLVTLALMAMWTVVPAATDHGVPWIGALRALAAATRQGWHQFPASLAPVPTHPGFVLPAVLGTGLAALVADSVAFRGRSALQAVVPAVALFSVCCVAGTSQHRPATLGVLVAAVLLVVASHRASVGAGDDIWIGASRRATLRSASVLSAAAGALAVLFAVVVVPGPATKDGRGVLGWSAGGPGGGGDRSVISPVVDLQTRIEHNGDAPVFTVTSPVASYWRLTSLDTFTGSEWESTDSYRGVSDLLPGLQTGTRGATTVTERFHIQGLSSIWMPTAFTPEAVHGGGQVSWDPVSDSLLAGSATSDGLDYSLTSVQYLQRVTPAALDALPGATVDPAHLRYLALPASVPAAVRDLARTITAGTHSRYAAALALEDYFIDSPTFQYSLAPPDDGYGTASLVDFLFHTHTGYCQQFAGAYAVLARAAGLPTRLAIGFTSGGSTGAGSYQVTDADAHTWPEVWFGPQVGWLPFEPTKGGGFSIPGATAYTGDTTGATTAPSPASQVAPVIPSPTVAPHHRPSTLPTDPPTTLGGLAPVHRSAPASVTPLVALLVVGAAGAWLLLGALGWTLRRRVRHRRGLRAAAPDRNAAEVLATWADVVDTLAWWGVVRVGDETVRDFAARAAGRLVAVLGDRRAAANLVGLAQVVEEAAYRPAPLAGVRVASSAAAAAVVQRALRRGAPASLRLRRVLDPRVAWRTATARPAGFDAA